MIDDSRRQLVDNVRIAIAQQNSSEAVLRVAVELIDAFSEDFNWTGVYMLDGDILRVGPYVGPETPHKEIKLNSGICGAAVSQKETILVNDVTSDPRFLACSPYTRSEIVVPLKDGEAVIGEIDIDSNRTSNFTSADREMLELIAESVVERLRQL
jgi:L-methionine (R)-S-oxide reductase